MAHTTAVIFAAILALSIGLNSEAKLETRRYYQIQGFDGSLLTVGGDKTGGVKMVTEDNHGTDPRQIFWVGAGESSEITPHPQVQNFFSTLLVGLEMKSNLIFQQTRSAGARYQWWIIQDLGNDKWQIQNARAGLCMSTSGKNAQPYVEICDRSSANQSWTFSGVANRGRLPVKPVTLPLSLNE